MTNKDHIVELLHAHPEGLDDDDISEITGIQPRQQVQQLCSQLASAQMIRRESVSKPGKRRKIHNFPVPGSNAPAIQAPGSEHEGWQRRLAALVAATGRKESDLLDEALRGLALKFLKESSRDE